MAVLDGRLRASGLVVCLGVLTACGTTSAEDRGASSSSVSIGVIAESVEALPNVETTTSSVPVPIYLLDDCVDYVQFGAWTGVDRLLAMWNEAAQDVPTLRANCDATGRADLAQLRQMSAEWSDVKIYLAASQAAPATTPAPAPTAAPTTQAPAALPPSAPVPAVQQPTAADCGDGSYVNVDGNCISGPVAAPSAPAGATAQCNDGTYSFSQHRSGTCSHHGGVAVWL
jgi:hypothetical protein